MNDELIDLLSNSRLTILGYTYKNERIKDELISSISSIRLDENFSSNSFLQYLRDKKISNLLNDEKSSKFITFDLLDIQNGNIQKMIDELQLVANTEKLKAGNINCSNIRYEEQNINRIKDLHHIRNYLSENYSLVISAPFYKGVDDKNHIKGGEKIIYIADLVLYIEDDKKLKV